MDSMLSQEEINALLNGAGGGDDGGSGSGTGSTANSDALSAEEKDAIGEISNISMGTAATTLSTLLNQKVNITTPHVEISNWDDISNAYERPCVFIQISYIEGLDGNNILILRENDVKIITDLMMGGDGHNTDGELTELHLSAICEAMNQMMGSAATSISSVLEKKVDISPPTASLVDMNDTISTDNLSNFLQGDFVRVSFRLEIGDLIDSELMQLYPVDFAKDLYRKFLESTDLGGTAEPAGAAPETAPAPAPQPTPAPQPQPAPAAYAAPPQQAYAAPPQQQYAAPPMQPVQPVNVAPAQFASFDTSLNPVMMQENIDLIKDVPLEVTVELGRTNKTIREILDFAPGTIIELNKLAGEPIDVLVNGKYIAKGEVVVIDDSFGIRITDIVK